MILNSNLFNQFVSACIEGMWVVDDQNRTTFVNESVAQMLGFPQEYFIGKEIGEFMDPEDAEEFQRKMNERKSGVNEYHEARFNRKGGDVLWTQCACSGLKNENGAYVGAVGMLTDITTRRKDELLLDAQKNVFETLVSGGSLEEALTFLLDPLSKIIKKVHASILLLEGERLTHGASLNLSKAFNAALEGYQIGPQAGSCGTAAYRKQTVIVSDIDTDPLWAKYAHLAHPFGFKACWSNPIMSREGKVLGTFALYFEEVRSPTDFEMQVLKDITAAAAVSIEHIRLLDKERKHHEQMNLLSEARYILSESLEFEDVTKKIPQLIVSKKIADWSFICLKNDDGVYRSTSIAAAPEISMEVDPSQILVFDLKSDWGFSRSIKDNRSIIEHVDLKFMEKQLERKDPDAPQPMHLKKLIELDLKSFISVPLTIRGKVIGGLLVASNRPGRYYNESDLKFMEELARSCALAIDNSLLFKKTKESVKAREEFISIASHELRTPLTSLKMRIDLLSVMLSRKVFPQDVMDKLNPIISEIQPDVKKFTRLIENLLDVSKFGAKKLQLNVENCNLSKHIEAELARIRPEFDSHQTELQSDIQPDINGNCDAIRLQQVVSNLLSNALKFGNKKPVKIVVTGNKSEITIKVIDRGIGISEEDRERIFKPFERAVSEKNFGGMGLGLYITHQIVISHGGTIDVESKLGEGATFIVKLPL